MSNAPSPHTEPDTPIEVVGRPPESATSPFWEEHQHSDDRSWHRSLSPAPPHGVPFWITACVRLMPPSQRDGSPVSPAVANAIVPAAQAFLERGIINRSRLSQVCGVEVQNIDWVLDYLERIRFLTRSDEAWGVHASEPSGYRGPLGPNDLYSALEAREQGMSVPLFCEACADVERRTEQWRREQWRRITQTRPPKRNTYIYIIGEEASPHVKIGMTTDLRRRLKSLQSTNPASLHIRWSALGGRDIEQQLHAEFARHRTHGEWFKFSAKADPVSAIRAEALLLGAVEVAK